MNDKEWVGKAAKPPNHGTYQVWHAGKVHAADVESTNVRDVHRLTRRPPERWLNHPAVTVHVENPRSTKLGDVIVDPTCGAWEVQKDGYLAVEPPAPVKERMEREGIVPQHISLLREWLEGMKKALAEHEANSKERDHDTGRGGR
jgi:hypothetical protein